MKACCYCGDKTKREPNAIYCWPCYDARQPALLAGVAATRKAIREGLLAPIDECYCVDCGAFAEMYDHRDYAKPLDVDPVCRRCNIRRGPAQWKRAA